MTPPQSSTYHIEGSLAVRGLSAAPGGTFGVSACGTVRVASGAAPKHQFRGVLFTRRLGRGVK